MARLLGRIFSNARVVGFAQDALLRMEPETAHTATINALKMGLHPTPSMPDAPELTTSFCGLTFTNPVGMAAGFDKNGEVAGAMSAIGFGFSEVGTVTPRPQDGNPKPRLFRIQKAGGVINRMGFNNDGHDAVFERLSGHHKRGNLGINIGANKSSDDFVADYVAGVKRFAPIADYLTVNISSPNTPGLRGLQNRDELERLLRHVLAERAQQPVWVPVLLKIAPDLDDDALDDIAAVVSTTDLDGMIVSNTTISRPGVENAPEAKEAGGLSGKPLFPLSTICLAKMRQRVGPGLPIIGVGGVHSAKSALAKFEAGANAIQLYSALVYGGFALLEEIKTGLTQAVRLAGRSNISELVGVNTDEWAAGRAHI